MTTCHGHSPGCAILPPMMRRLHPGAVTLLVPHSRGSDLSAGDGDGAMDGDGDAAEGMWYDVRGLVA